MLPTPARRRIPRRMGMTMHDDKGMRLRHERSRWPKNPVRTSLHPHNHSPCRPYPKEIKERTTGREVLLSMVHGPTRSHLLDMHLTRLDNCRRLLHVHSDQGLIPGIWQTTVRKLPVTPITEEMRSPALLHPYSNQTPNRHSDLPATAAPREPKLFTTKQLRSFRFVPEAVITAGPRTGKK